MECRERERVVGDAKQSKQALDGWESIEIGYREKVEGRKKRGIKLWESKINEKVSSWPGTAKEKERARARSLSWVWQSNGTTFSFGQGPGAHTTHTHGPDMQERKVDSLGKLL
jgi:hypothetical protein